MKRILILVLFCNILFSQQKKKEIDCHIISNDIEKSIAILDNFINDKNIIVLEKNERELNKRSNNLKSQSYVFSIKSVYVSELEKVIESLGKIKEKRKNTISKYPEKEKIELEKINLEKERDNYKKYLSEMSNKNSELYLETEKKVIEIEEDIKLKNDILLKINEEDSYDITIYIEEKSEKNYTSNYINQKLLGVEYSFRNIFNPLDGYTSKNHNGITIKYTNRIYENDNILMSSYIFTSYYWAVQRNPEHFNNMLLIGLGGDYYFNRDNNKDRYLEPKGNFNFGLEYFFRQNSTVATFFITPSFGLDIVSTKKILLNTNIAYHLPFYRSNNTMGLLLNVSFNYML